MSHQIHTTDAIVLSTETSGEQNVRVTMLTKEYGLVRATVQSGRAVQNKHRMHLVRFARISVNMVSGRGGWRVTGVHARAEFRSVYKSPVFPVLLRATRLIAKITPEDETHLELFEFFDTVLAQISQGESFSNKLVRGFEIFTAMKILAHLGYWKSDEDLSFQPETFASLASAYESYVRAINTALETTHLMRTDFRK